MFANLKEEPRCFSSSEIRENSTKCLREFASCFRRAKALSEESPDQLTQWRAWVKLETSLMFWRLRSRYLRTYR
jgi:hypothetical protein